MKGNKTFEEYRKRYCEYMFNPDNYENCDECPENKRATSSQDLRFPCGQYNCWVRLHCKIGGRLMLTAESKKGEHMKEPSIYQQLLRNAQYALKSHSRDLVCQTYGAAGMAMQLDAITYEEFTVLNNMLIRSGINNSKAGLE